MVRTNWPRRGATVLAVCCLLVTGFAGVGSAQTTPTEIDGCTTIDEPGRYVLTGDATDGSPDACVDIQSDDVVLDGDGNEIVGNDTGENGTAAVGVADASNVTVRNVTVRNWSAGVRLTNVSEGTASGVTASENGDGAVVYDSTDTTLTNSTLTDNADDGIDAADSNGLVVADTILTGNGDRPIELTNTTNVSIQSANATAGEIDGTPDGDTPDAETPTATGAT